MLSYVNGSIFESLVRDMEHFRRPSESDTSRKFSGRRVARSEQAEIRPDQPKEEVKQVMKHLLNLDEYFDKKTIAFSPREPRELKIRRASVESVRLDLLMAAEQLSKMGRASVGIKDDIWNDVLGRSMMRISEPKNKGLRIISRTERGRLPTINLDEIPDGRDKNKSMDWLLDWHRRLIEEIDVLYASTKNKLPVRNRTTLEIERTKKERSTTSRRHASPGTIRLEIWVLKRQIVQFILQQHHISKKEWLAYKISRADD